MGVSNGLHSKAALLLPLLLREDVLERSDLKPATEVCICSFPGSLHDAVQGCGYGCEEGGSNEYLDPVPRGGCQTRLQSYGNRLSQPQVLATHQIHGAEYGDLSDDQHLLLKCGCVC